MYRILEYKTPPLTPKLGTQAISSANLLHTSGHTLEQIKQSIDDSGSALSATEASALKLLEEIADNSRKLHTAKREAVDNTTKREKLKTASGEPKKLAQQMSKCFRVAEEATAEAEIYQARSAELKRELQPLLSVIEAEHSQLFADINEQNNQIKQSYLDSDEVKAAYRVIKAAAEFKGICAENLLRGTEWDDVDAVTPAQASQLKPLPAGRRELLRRIEQAVL